MLSVIIPTLNCAANIGRLINEIKRTSLKDFEIIMVDDFSSDNTVDVCIAAGAHKVLKLPAHKGPAYARNFGASRAMGENLLFVDSDIVLDLSRDVIALVDEIFKENPDIDCIASMSDVQPVVKNPVSYNMSIYHAYYMNLIIGNKESILLRIKYFSTRFGGIRKEKYRKTGGLYESLTGVMSEDGEFGYRCYELGYKTYISRLLTHKHIYSTSFSKFVKSYFLATMVIYFIHKKMDTSPDPSIPIVEEYRRIFGLLMVLSPLLLLFLSLKLYALIITLWFLLFILSFGQMNRLIFSQVPARYWVPWYIVYLAITPVIASGYLLGVIRYHIGTRLLEGVPSKIEFYN